MDLSRIENFDEVNTSTSANLNATRDRPDTGMVDGRPHNNVVDPLLMGSTINNPPLFGAPAGHLPDIPQQAGYNIINNPRLGGFLHHPNAAPQQGLQVPYGYQGPQHNPSGNWIPEHRAFGAQGATVHQNTHTNNNYGAYGGPPSHLPSYRPYLPHQFDTRPLGPRPTPANAASLSQSGYWGTVIGPSGVMDTNGPIQHNPQQYSYPNNGFESLNNAPAEYTSRVQEQGVTPNTLASASNLNIGRSGVPRGSYSQLLRSDPPLYGGAEQAITQSGRQPLLGYNTAPEANHEEQWDQEPVAPPPTQAQDTTMLDVVSGPAPAAAQSTGRRRLPDRIDTSLASAGGQRAQRALPLARPSIGSNDDSRDLSRFRAPPNVKGTRRFQPAPSDPHESLPANHPIPGQVIDIGQGWHSGRNMFALFGDDPEPRTKCRLRIRKGRHEKSAGYSHNHLSPSEVLPARLTALEIVQQFPNHAWGTGLRLFIAENISGETIWRNLPQQCRLAEDKRRPWNYLQHAIGRQISLMLYEETGEKVPPTKRAEKRRSSQEADLPSKNKKQKVASAQALARGTSSHAPRVSQSLEANPMDLPAHKRWRYIPEEQYTMDDFRNAHVSKRAVAREYLRRISMRTDPNFVRMMIPDQLEHVEDVLVERMDSHIPMVRNAYSLPPRDPNEPSENLARVINQVICSEFPRRAGETPAEYSSRVDPEGWRRLNVIIDTIVEDYRSQLTQLIQAEDVTDEEEEEVSDDDGDVEADDGSGETGTAGQE